MIKIIYPDRKMSYLCYSSLSKIFYSHVFIIINLDKQFIIRIVASYINLINKDYFL